MNRLCAEEDYERTFAHEVSHAIARKIQKSGPAHGSTWRNVMGLMGQHVAPKYLNDEYDRQKRIGRKKKRRRIGRRKVRR